MSENDKNSAIVAQNTAKLAFAMLQRALSRKDIGIETIIFLQNNVKTFSDKARSYME